MIDIHCHILPGVDDGAKDEAMTREMLRRAADAGIKGMICTPHVYRPQQIEESRRSAEAVRAMARAQRISYGRGCELSYRALMTGRLPVLYEQLRDDRDVLKPFCMASTRCILLEMSNDQLFPDWEIALTQLAECGYQIIIAHPERYSYIQRDIALAEEMISYGCELQLDAGGLMAPLFSSERTAARRLLNRGLASYIASDAHCPQDYAVFEKAARTFAQEWPKENRLFAQLRERYAQKRQEQKT